MCIYDGPYVSLSLQRFFYFPSAILYFPSAIFYFPSPFFKFPFRVSFFTSLHHLSYFSSEFSFTSLHHFLYFPSPFFLLPFRVFLLHFSIFKCILLPVSIFTSLPSLFTSLQSIHNSFYLPSVFFTTLQVIVIFLLFFRICLLPFSFFKLFLLSFGIFIVSFLIFKYRRKLNCNNFLLDKKFLKSISKASLGHVKTILKPSLKINDWIIAGYLFRYLVCGLN